MERMSMILTVLLCNQRLTRKILLTAYRNYRSGYKMLKEYQDEGLIEEVRYDGIKTPVLKITKKGIVHLSEDTSPGWAERMNLKLLQRQKDAGLSKGKNQSRITSVSVSEANAFCLFSGFDTVLLPHLPRYRADNRINDKTLNVVYKAVTDYDAGYLGEDMLSYTAADIHRLGDGYVRFIPKTYFESVTGLGGRDYASTKAVGFADSRFKSLLVYDYFRGYGHVVLVRGGPDSKIYPALANHSLCEKNSYPIYPCGVMMVEDAEHFASRFRMNRTVHPEESTFADGFAHFYIVPKSREGCIHFKWLMTVDDARFEEEVISLFFSRADVTVDRQNRLFPVCFGNVRYAVGCTLDIPFLKAVLEHIAAHGSAGIGIICFKWQIPFYSALTGNIKFLEIEFG